MPLCSQGSMRRVRAGTDRPMGRSIASGGDPKGCRGERREAGIQWIQPPQAVSDPEFRQTTSGAHGSAGRADCLPRGKPPCLQQQATTLPKKLPLVGNDAPTPARSGTCRPKGRSPFSFDGPKGCRGERREARAQWAQPPRAVSDPEFRQTTSGAHGSAGRADCLPRGKPFGAPAGAYPCPRWGLTRRLRRGRRACSPMGRSIAS